MASRNKKPKVRSLDDIVQEVNNSDEYGYKQLRERLAIEQAERTSVEEEGEPQGFLSSAPSDLEVTASMQATPEEGWLGGVQRAGYESISNLFGGDGYGGEDNRPLIQRATGGMEKLVSAILPDAIERGMNLGQASIAMGMPEGQVMDTTTGRMRSDRIERMGVAAQEREQANMFQASRSTQEAMAAMANADSAGGWIEAATPAALGQMLGESVGQQLPQLAITAGSAGLGLPLMAASTYNAEFQGEIEKAAQSDGVDINNAQRFERWMIDNPDKVKAAEDKGRTRGTIIAGVDLVSFGAGGAIAKAVDNTGLKRAAFLAGANLVADVGGGAGGEAAAQLATEGKIKVGEVLNEGLAGLPLTLTQTPGQLLEGRRRGIEIDTIERQRFNDQLDDATIEQGNAQIAERVAAEGERIRAEAEAQRIAEAQAEADRVLAERSDSINNAEQGDMFGEDPNVVGTFEEQEALRRYEDERRALSLQDRRRAFAAAEQANAADQAAYADVVDADRNAQFDAAEAERARVAASQAAIDPAFNPPAEGTMASQLRAALASRGVEPAVAEQVVQEVKAPASGPVDVTTSKDGRDYRYTLATDGNAYTYDGNGNIMEGREVWSPRSQEALDAASSVTNGMLALRSNEVAERAAYSAANKEIVAADTEGRPLKFSMVMVDGRGRFEGEQFPSRVVAPAVGVDGTQRVYEYVLTPDKHLRRTYRDERGTTVGVEYLATNKETGSREWSDKPPGMLAPNMEWGPAVDLKTAGEEITAQANNLKPVATQEAPAAPAASAELPTTQGNGFIGPARGRRTEPNVGENRTTRIDESDAPAFPAMQRTSGSVQESPAVVEDVAPEQMELEGMDVKQPATAKDALAAAKKKRADKAKKENDEALKKARAAHTRDREKFLDGLLARGLSDQQEEAEMSKWMRDNPYPTEATTTAPVTKPTATPDPLALADKAITDRKKKDVASWKRGQTSVVNRAAAEAKSRKMADGPARAFIAAKAAEYLRDNPNPANQVEAASPTATIAENDPRIDEAVAAMRLFDETTPEAELRAQAIRDLSDSTLNQDSNRLPEDKRASLEDVRSLLGMRKGDSARRIIGNGVVQLVTDDTAAQYRRSGDASDAAAWYNGDKMYVNVNRLNKDNLMGELLGAIGHEGKHAADASGKGQAGISSFIGVEANRRLRSRIEEAAQRGDRNATNAVRRANAAAEARPDLPGLYEVELPAYYITEANKSPTTLYRGLVSALRVGVKNLLGVQDVNVNDIRYMADKMVENLSYETSVQGSTSDLLQSQAEVDLDQGMYGGTVRATATTTNGTFDLEDSVAPEGADFSEFGQVRKVTAFDNGQEIGSLIYANDGTPPTVEVDPAYRRRGVGTAMLKMARDQGGVLGDGSSGIRGRGSEYRTSDGQAFRSNANEDSVSLNYNTTLNQDVEPDNRFNPRPGPELAKSALARVTENAGSMAASLLSSTGGLGRETNAALQDSVGEAAHYAGLAQKYSWELNRGIAIHARKNGITEDQANAEVAKRMTALESIPSPARREAALSNYVAQNPELTPMLDMYRTIAGFSNEIANTVLARRPLTEADRKFAQQLKDSAFGYTSRLYTSRQGEAGKSISRKMLRTASKARAKSDNGKTLTKQEAEAMETYENAAQYIGSRLVIPEMSDMLGMRQSRINELFNTWVDMDAAKYFEAAYDDALRTGADEITAKEAAKTAMIEELDSVREVSQDKGRLNDKVDAVIRSLLGLNASTPTASMIGGLREDRGVLQKRQDLDPSIRRLMGEVVSSPAVMLSITMAKQGELIARDRFLTNLVDSGLVVSQDLAGIGPFRKYTAKLRGDTAGPADGMMTTPEVARIINAQLEMYSGIVDAAAISFMQGDALTAALARGTLKGVSKVAGAAKIASVVTSPFAMVMNAVGSPLMLLPNGVYSPKHIANAMEAAKDSVMNTLREGSNYNDVLADAVRWNVIDSARLQELRSSVHRTLQDKVVNPSVTNRGRHAFKQGFGATAEVFAMTDAWTKIAAFMKQKEFLTDFYKAEGTKRTDEEISSEAAQIVRDTNFTYSKVPPVIRNGFERVGLTMFATYFYSVPQTIAGNYVQAWKDVKRGQQASTEAGRKQAWTMAAQRIGGTTAATAGAVVATKMLAEIINGMGDEDEDKIKAMADMLRDQQPSSDPIYLGKNEDGKPLFFLLNRIDPFGPVNDLIRIMGQEGLSDVQKSEQMMKAISGMIFTNTAIAEMVKVFTDENRGMGDARIERLPGVGKIVTELEGMAGYADWARSLATLVDKTMIPGVANAFDPENPKVAGNFNSGVAQALGMMTRGTGGRAVVADPGVHLKSLGFELKEKKDEARRRVSLMVANGESPEDVADFITSESSKMFQDFEQVQRVYNGMVDGLDMSRREAEAILKDRQGAGLNDVQLSLIRRGLLRGDKEMAIELAGILSKKSLTDRTASTRRMDKDKEEARTEAKSVLDVLRRDYGIKAGE